MKQLPIGLNILAVIGFFLPWSSIKCEIPGEGEVVIQQSGLQMVTKSYSASTPDGSALDSQDAGDKDDELGIAVLPAITVLLAIIAIALAAQSKAGTAGRLAVGAGIVAILQLLIGFPLEPNTPDLGELGGLGGELANLHHIEFGFWITVVGCIVGGIVGITNANGDSNSTTSVAEPVAAIPTPSVDTGSPEAAEEPAAPPAPASEPEVAQADDDAAVDEGDA